METFENDYETLYFDYNVMLLGMVSELKAQNEKMAQSGMTTSRQGAYALAMRARLAAERMDG